VRAAVSQRGYGAVGLAIQQNLVIKQAAREQLLSEFIAPASHIPAIFQVGHGCLSPQGVSISTGNDASA
jgi:hypothetical protein